MALRGGNALNKGSARKSAKFVKPKKTATKVARKAQKPIPKKTPSKARTQTTQKVMNNRATVSPRKSGAAKAKSKMMGGKGRMSAKHPARRK